MMSEELRTERLVAMTADERARLELLDAALRSNSVRERIRPIVDRLRAELARNKEALMTWEPVPLSIFDIALPSEIRSAWVFVLRAGTDTGPERHPNSHQRMMSFQGKGNMQTGELENSRSNILASDSNAPLEQRWISIPPNTWHRPVVGEAADWAVVSFHTVLAEELIEERPDEGERGMKQMKYLARNAPRKK
jgi:hypothetical protein